MKITSPSKMLSLCLALIFAAACALPVSALGNGPTVSEITDSDAEKLTAFWHQPAYNGLNNGEAVYDHEWNAGDYWGDVSGMYYHDGWNTDLISPSFGNSFDFNFAYYVPFSIYDDSDPDMPPVFADGRDYVYPDLHGELDLAGTNLRFLKCTDDTMHVNHTHISGLDLDGCGELLSVAFNEQMYCRSISAVNCGKLAYFSARGGAYRSIAFSPEAFEENVVTEALGNGCVGAFLGYDGELTVYAYPASGKFIGWYRSGELVSTALEYTCTAGGEYTAYFGGDADNDGAITASDALLLLRRAMGIAELEVSAYSADVNGNGVVDADDALIIMRLALGIL